LIIRRNNKREANIKKVKKHKVSIENVMDPKAAGIVKQELNQAFKILLGRVGIGERQHDSS